MPVFCFFFCCFYPNSFQQNHLIDISRLLGIASARLNDFHVLWLIKKLLIYFCKFFPWEFSILEHDSFINRLCIGKVLFAELFVFNMCVILIDLSRNSIRFKYNMAIKAMEMIQMCSTSIASRINIMHHLLHVDNYHPNSTQNSLLICSTNNQLWNGLIVVKYIYNVEYNEQQIFRSFCAYQALICFIKILTSKKKP